MKSLDNKVIIYDSNCRVCTSYRNAMLKFTHIPKEKTAAFQTLPDELTRLVDPDKFKNGMALIDTTGAHTIYGSAAVAHILASQYGFLDTLLRLKPFSLLFDFIYQTQAYNRYIMATPRNRFKCDCEPDRVVKYRISYIVITLVIATLLTALFGISLRHFFTGISASEAAMQMLLMAGSGWALQMLLAAALLKDKAIDYIGHLGSIMVVGTLILVPWMLFYAITASPTPYLPIASVFVSSTYMLYLHFHRVRYLGISQGWTLSWFILLQSAAIFWIAFFHLT